MTAIPNKGLFKIVNAVGLTANFCNYFAQNHTPIAYCMRGVSFVCDLVSAGMLHKAKKRNLETFSFFSMCAEICCIGVDRYDGMCIPSAFSQTANLLCDLDKPDKPLEIDFSHLFQRFYQPAKAK